MSITDFLLARIAEEEAVAHEVIAERRRQIGQGSRIEDPDTVPFLAWEDGPSPFVAISAERVLADCEAKRSIVDFHQNWPVLVSKPPTIVNVDEGNMNLLAVRATQQILWATEQEYRDRFGDEPPTSPMLRALAAVYADHPDHPDNAPTR